MMYFNFIQSSPACVSFNLEKGSWSDIGCEAIETVNSMVKCACTHLTSFTILMVCAFRSRNNNIMS